MNEGMFMRGGRGKGTDKRKREREREGAQVMLIGLYN